MITKRIVLILGAGASIPYGYPSGHQLKWDIIKKLNASPSRLRISLKNLGISDEHINEFREVLFESGQFSIDALLEKRPEFIDVGKLSIVLMLIPLENEKDIFDESVPPVNDYDKKWYSYLFQKLKAGTRDLSDFMQNKLSIITFNYDRSLDYFLYTVLKTNFTPSEEKLIKAINHIEIVHVHGQIGTLPWQEKNSRLYDKSIPPSEEIKKASEQIKIISEIESEDDGLSRAMHLLDRAEEVHFLGFAYHDENMRKLRFNEQFFKKKIETGTSLGLGKMEKDEILSKFNIDLINDDQFGILDHLKNNVSFI